MQNLAPPKKHFIKITNSIRMKKVLIIATSHLTRGGITAVIKAHQKGEQWEKFHCKWIETHIDKSKIYKLLYFITGWIKFIVLLPNYQIVHIHLSEPASAIRKCFFLPFAYILNKKIIIHFHAFSPETSINSRYKKIYHYLFTHANKIIVLSQLWEKYVNETFKDLKGKVQVIYNPCTSVILADKYPSKKYILYAGTINQRKGYKDLIIAFSQISSKYPDWKIIFAGNGEIDKGRQLARHLNIEKQINFLGWVSGKEKDKIFKEAQIFCLPSYAEGFPMAILDAWSYSLPVITTPVGGIPDIAENGKNLLLFQPGNTQQLAQQISLLIENEELRSRLSNASKTLSNTIFNLNIINKQIGDLYSKLLS